MRSAPWICLALAFGYAQGNSPAPENHRICMAVFSSRQLFWPELGGPGKSAGRSKVKPLPPRIGILPLSIRDYQESLPCDSCHRLSANGMEFYLENYLTERVRNRFPGHAVELVAPHFALLTSGKVDLMAYLDSLELPWNRWFDGYQQNLIYRPKDWMTPVATRKRLDKLGGILGMTHLLLPAQARVRVMPKRSDGHEGGLDWGFRLLCWNVAAGRPEWVLDYAGSIPNMDLDESLDKRLDQRLVAAWDSLPRELRALWKQEPQ